MFTVSRCSTLFATGFLVAAIASRPVHAQGAPVDISGDISQALSQALQKALSGLPEAIEKAKKNAVRVNPEAITVDASAKTATFELVNPGDDSVVTKLSMQFEAPAAPGAKAIAGGLMDDPAADSAKGAAGKEWSLASWVTDLPSELTLKAHETRKITVHLTVPESAAAGEYSAHVVVATVPNFKFNVAENQEPSADGSASINLQGAQFVIGGDDGSNDALPKHSAKLTYKVGN